MNTIVEAQDKAPISGGSITFSTDVNAVVCHPVKVINSLYQHILTIYYRRKVVKILSQLIVDYNNTHHEHIKSYTIHRMNGCYHPNYTEPAQYEHSFRLEILDTNVDILKQLAGYIVQRFRQRSVMVIDYSSQTKCHVRISATERA